MPQSIQPSYIAPERLYTLRCFHAASGVSATRIREGRRNGIMLKTLDVGKRKYVRGSDGINYIEQLAQLPSTDQSFE